MRTDAAKPAFGIVDALCYGVLVGIALVGLIGPAKADADPDRSFELSARQWHLVDQMTNATLFATLGLNSERGIRAIEQRRALFARTLNGLLRGDGELGLVAASEPEAAQRMARVDALWRRYDAALGTVLVQLRMAPRVAESDVEALMDAHAPISLAIDDATAATAGIIEHGLTHEWDAIRIASLQALAAMGSDCEPVVAAIKRLQAHESEPEVLREIDTTLTTLGPSKDKK